MKPKFVAGLSVVIATAVAAATFSLPAVAAPPPAHYGATGTHWPSATPQLSDTFSYDVTVEPTWEAIQAALNKAPATGNAVIRVKPGALPAGKGGGSNSPAVLTKKDTLRTSKVLIVPRDGYGTVTGSGGLGYSFNTSDVTLAGFDFREQAVMVRGASDFALAWSTADVLNVTANAAHSKNLEFIETIIPELQAANTDTSSVRVANGYTVDGLIYKGGYWAPTYKDAGSSAHTDTLQFSGVGSINNVLIEDSILFQSSNQGMQTEVLGSIAFKNTVIVGGQRGTERYPVAKNQAAIRLSNALWGNARSATADGLTVMGSINTDYKWKEVTNSFVSARTGSTPAKGSFAVNSAFTANTPPTAWLDAHAPLPTQEYLAEVWKNFGVLTAPEPEPTATPSATPSATPTATPTPTDSPTPVITPTPTPTVVPTPVATPTPEPTPAVPAKVSPTIAKVYPSGSTVTTADPLLAFSIQSDSAIASATIGTALSPTPLALTQEGGRYTFKVPVAAIPKGNHTFTVKAVDADGDTTSQAFTITVAK
jgi:hypothetical protein